VSETTIKFSCKRSAYIDSVYAYHCLVHAGKRVITAALLATKFANTPAASVSDNDDNFCSQKPALVVVHDCVLEQWIYVLHTWTQSSAVELCSNEKKLSRHIQKVQEGDYDIAVCSYATLALRTHKVSAFE
jgi:hypothetical protein